MRSGTTVPAVLAAVLALSACRATERAPTPSHMTAVHPYLGLDKVHPADVAVLPVTDESRGQKAGGGLPTGVLRQALYEGLVERLYSPLALDYVDGHWVEASATPPRIADAVLTVRVTYWDTSAVGTHGSVIASAEALLLDGDDLEERLWGVTLNRRLAVGIPGPGDDEREIPREAARLLAAEILARLPERDAVEAHR